MATLDVAMSGTGEFELPSRKKPKFQDLPLTNTQHDAIDGMLHTFKKKGEFDALRKKAFQQYNESAQRGMFEASLRNFSSTEIDRDSLKYLRPDRRIAAPLLEGAAARANVYDKTEADVNAYIDQFMANAERALREIRRKDVGDEAAEEEIRKGSKSEAEYAAEAEQRRHDRAKKFAQDEKLRKRKEAQERKKKELEALKKKQEALQKETERLQREQKRRAERDAWKQAEKERERQRIKQFNEEREKAKKEAEEREKAIHEERERRQKERQEREQKRLEAEALDLLLREGQAMAEKARRPELERSESMEPPARLKHPKAPKDTHGKNQIRAQGLMPTSLTLRKGERSGDKAQAEKGDKDAKEATPVIPTGPRRDRDRVSRPRSPSPARSTHSSRRRESSLDARPGRDRRESLYRDISAEREAWKARQRGQPDRNRDRDRDRSRDRDRDRDRERDRDRDRTRDTRKREDERDEGEVVERAARSKSPREPRENNYRPAGARRNNDSRSPPRRSARERTRSRSPPRRRRADSRDRRRERDRDRDRSRSPVGIDRYIPGSGRRPKEDEEEAPQKRREDEDEAPRRRRDEGEEGARRRPRDDDHLDSIIRDERNMPRRGRDDDDDQPRRRPIREDGDDRSQSRRPPREPREPREVDEDHLNSIIRDERTAPRRRPRYDDRDRDRERDRPRGSDIDRYIPGGGTSARVDEDRERDRDRTRRRERSRSRDRERSRDRYRDRSRVRRDRSRDRDRDREREREKKCDDSRDRERRPSKAPGAPETAGERATT